MFDDPLLVSSESELLWFHIIHNPEGTWILCFNAQRKQLRDLTAGDLEGRVHNEISRFSCHEPRKRRTLQFSKDLAQGCGFLLPSIYVEEQRESAFSLGRHFSTIARRSRALADCESFDIFHLLIALAPRIRIADGVRRVLTDSSTHDTDY